MKDRAALHPGRVKLVPVPGVQDTYDMTRDDSPTEAGTPINKATLLTDDTADAIWNGSAPTNPTVNDALMQLTQRDADRVVEQGTIAAWAYRKWESGVLEYWATITYTGACNTAWGSMFVHDDAFESKTYPTAFAATPRIVTGIRTGGGNFWLYTGNTLASRSRTPSFGIIRPTSSDSVAAALDIYVRGTV